MPYKCVHCGNMIADASEEILKGCNGCGSKFFFYIRKEKLEELQHQPQEEDVLSAGEKQQAEEDIRDIAGLEDSDAPVVLDIESIRIVKPGKYLLDIPKLFESGLPQIYQLEDGKYIIDLSSRAASGKQ